MEKIIKNDRARGIANAVVLIVVGILAICFYRLAANVFAIASGSVLIAIGCLYGLAAFFSFGLFDPFLIVPAIVLAALGAWIVADPGIYLYLIAIAAAIYLIYSGIREINYSIALKDLKSKDWWIDLVAGILFLIGGVAVFAVDVIGGDSFRLVTTFVGASLLLEGLIELILILAFHRSPRWKKRKHGDHDVVSEQ
ncbi:MAG: DUF308 domain-containing protein [Bacilli bacterium]|nr:DUF308 domain-containing protein [Bacilli bacterium]